MKLLIIAGFLGSGKTTLLLKIARKMSVDSVKVAIIENEMGEIGVDGQYLSLEGLNVKELFGGCICCTLSSGLIETLEKLELSYQPDIVIMEATGAARPGDVVSNLKEYKSGVNGIQVVTLVDANRYGMLVEMMKPLLFAQIEAADMLVINKTDLVNQNIADRISIEISSLNPGAGIINTSLEQDLDFSGIMGGLK